ncbi:CaiB/BaiF CoA transferase family protein [Natronomonas sp. EA1]|uniref:CaiB/BaiF CoA transferase family protein n=1 Tax=Natronomonas sp. EA1 TaxID=3421655 RepID=UPI003EBFE22A
MQLDGVRVLDLTRLLPGPYATQLLADAGADVVKVEDTGAGDYARAMPPLTDEGYGIVFDAVNRHKRSVTLDLKSEAGREAFYALVETADAVIESFRPGVVDRLGVDYETCREHNPGIVYCSLSGFGATGPLAQRPGHDLNYAGVAGMLDMTRAGEDEVPSAPGYPVADMGGGLLAAFSILGGLLSRELGGEGGEYFDVSLTDAVVSFGQTVAPMALRDENPRPGDTQLTGAYPWYGVYEAKEGYVTLAALEPQFWEGFCEAVGHEEWISLHTTDDPAEREALREALEALFATRTRDEWVDRLADEDTAVDGVYTPEEALSHPQIQSREYVHGGERPRVGFPLRGSDVSHEAGDLPAHGEHTETVLREAGLDDDAMARLRAEGAI